MNPLQLDARPFTGKTVVVTGAGSGIGAACAHLLSVRGAQVVVADRDAAAAAGVAKECGGIAMPVDVADAAAVADMAAHVQAQLGSVHGLVTCAGVMPGHIDRVENLDLPEWRRYFDVNVHGTYACVAAFGPAMARAGCGSIVCIASVCGLRSTPLHAYGASKAAVVQTVRNLAGEWGRSGVRVNSISPGYVLTEGLRRSLENGHRDADRLRDSAALGRVAEPHELAQAVAFLLSDEASAVTGIDLPVDAGWLTAATWTFYGGLPPSQAQAS